MMFTNIIAGERVDEGERLDIRSLDGEHVGTVPNSSPIDFIEAREFARTARPVERSLDERIELFRDIAERYVNDDRLDLVKGVSGTPERYLNDTRQAVAEWAANIDAFVENVDAYSRMRDGKTLAERSPVAPYVVLGAGNFEAFEGLFLLGQSLLSGSHFIVRPSKNDLGTHIFMEHLAATGAADAGQKLTWSSKDQPDLIKSVLEFSKGFSIFASDDSYDAMTRIQIPKRNRTDVIDLTSGRSAHRYGSGYAAAVVTAAADLEQAARDITYAALTNKGNKCWAITNVFADHNVYARFTEAMVAAAEEARAEELPRFSSEALESVAAALPSGRRFGEIGDDCMDLLVYEGVDARNMLGYEIGVPVVAVVPYDGLGEAADALQHTLAARNRSALINLAVFGDDEQQGYLRQYVPHHNSTLNERPVVDLFKPHEGNYFMLDSTR